jgi:hypothetical protein
MWIHSMNRATQFVVVEANSDDVIPLTRATSVNDEMGIDLRTRRTGWSRHSVTHACAISQDFSSLVHIDAR